MAESPVIYLLGKLASFFENEIQHMRESPEEMIALKGEFERIKAFLRVADSTEEGDGEVKIWIKQIREVAYDAEDALDEFKLLLAHDHEGRGLLYKIPCCVRNMKARYRLAAAIRSISSRMKAICEDNQRLYEKLNRAQHGSSSACEDSTWQDHRADAVLVEKTGLVGIEEPKEKLTQWLVSGNSEQEVISVVGMGGLGKTTLTKEVFDGPVVKKHFSVCAWVTLSPSSKTEELLMDMLQQIASSIMEPVPSGTDTMNINWLKRTIRSFLQGRRSRYLIVLDDVWHMDRWDAVKYALPNNNLGSRVMITTRNSDLALASCTEFNGKVYKMQPLPVEQSWELFCRKIFKKNSCPSQLEEICTDILKKCEGLPLAIVAISRVLATKDQWRINEWDLVRRCLPSEINGNDRLKNMKKVLSLSFNDLPYYLKSCLLQISVFPEGHVIERMRLIRHWVAEGFVEMEDAKTMEEVADDYLNELVNRSLIQVVEIDSDGRIKSCRIHGLLLKIINLKSRDQNFATILDKQSSTWPDRIRRCSVHNEFRLGQQNMLLSHLRSLYMFGEDNCSLYSILSGDLKLLCVLDLQNAPLRRFPPQVVDMRSLKFLSLRNTQIQTVPTSIGRLQNLETLDLKHTRVTSLPMEIMKLQRLCHLLVYHHHTVGYAHYKYGFSTPARIGAFQSLQKLGRIYVDDDRTNNVISELGKLNQLRRLCILKLKKEDGKRLCWSIAKLTNLQALSVFSSEDDDIDLQDLSSPPPLLQRIYLKGQMQALPHWIANMHGLVKLHLRWCLLKEDPLPSLQDLPNLVHLELLQVHDWQTLCFKAKGFQKLKILVLDYYEELIFVQIEEEAMSNLEKLMIQRCKQLKSMPSGIEHLTKLKVLQFFDMRFFDMPKELQLDERDEGYQKVAHVPVLRYGYWRDGAWETTVTNNIADSHRKFGFKTLGEIGALQCLQKLRYIEANDETSSILIRQIRKLIQLRRLCILKLKKEDGGKLCVSITKLTNLRALSVSSLKDAEIDLQNLDSPPQLLQRVYLRGKLQTLPHWIAKLPSLAKLHLKWSHLEEDPMSALQSMPNLVHLELLQVYSWQKLCFKAKGFKKLKILGLDCFEELTLIQVEEGAMPCLEKWSIQRCKCLKNVPSGIEYLSKLKVLELFDMPDELIEKLKPEEQDEEYRKVAHVPELSYGYWRDGA